MLPISISQNDLFGLLSPESGWLGRVGKRNSILTPLIGRVGEVPIHLRYSLIRSLKLP